MKALIFGITGQDGSYMADLLLSKGYYVIGIARRSSDNNRSRIAHLKEVPNFTLLEGDITDQSSIINIFLSSITGDEIVEVYNFAAQSHVGTSFDQPGLTWDVTGKGCMNILQSIVDLNLQSKVKFFQASSSEMFGSAYTERKFDGTKNDRDITTHIGKENIENCDGNWYTCYQDENTKFLPQSPYAIAKCAAHMATRLYREAYGLHASAAIMFNHESPRRGENFVTRKITKWIGEFKAFEDKVLRKYKDSLSSKFYCSDYINYCVNEKSQECIAFPKLRLGNLEAKRDWGHSADYVHACWLMLQQESPDDYVVCTEETHSIKDFLSEAFKHIGIVNWSNYVLVDPKFYRPAEVDYLLGNCSKAKRKLCWNRSYDFNNLVTEMVENDIREAKKNVRDET